MPFSPMGKSVGRSRGRSRSPPQRGPYGRPSRFENDSRSPPRGRYDGPRPSRFDSSPSSRFDGPAHPSRFNGPPSSHSRFEGPPIPGRFDGPPSAPGRFDGPPPHGRFDGPPRPGRFDGSMSHRPRFEGPSPSLSRFEGPPPTFDHPGPGLEIPPPSLPDGPGNDIEIIVVNREQTGYAEMIEKRLKEETPVKYIDVLFLSSPQAITMTLNDLYERCTLYAIVVTQANEEKRSCTLHILRNTEEHRNIPIDEAIPMIARDFTDYMANMGPPPPPSAGPPTPGDGYQREPSYEMPKPSDVPNYTSVPSSAPLFPAAAAVATNGSNQSNVSIPPTTSVTSSSTSSRVAASSEKRLPDDIAYLLRTTLSEGGVQFLSLQQIDSIIDYFKKERDRLTSSAPRQATDNYKNDYQSTTQIKQANSGYLQSNVGSNLVSSASGSQLPSVPTDPKSLLENPQIKAALNSLLQIGAISTASTSSSVHSHVNNFSSLSSTTNNGSSSSSYPNNTSLSYTTPSYQSTSSSNVQNSSSAPYQYGGSLSSSNTASYQQSSNQTGPTNQTRRHPLMGTEISGPPGTSSYSSYGMKNKIANNDNISNQLSRGYSNSSSRY